MCPVNTKGTDPVRLVLVAAQWRRIFIFMLLSCRPFSVRKHHQDCLLTCLRPLEWGGFWLNEQVTPSVNRTAEQEFSKQQLPTPQERNTWEPFVQDGAPGSGVRESYTPKLLELSDKCYLWVPVHSPASLGIFYVGAWWAIAEERHSALNRSWRATSVTLSDT